MSVRINGKALLGALWLSLLLGPGLSHAQPACTHYAAPTGSGTVCTLASPCQVTTWLTNGTLRAPPNVLCLRDGTYTGSTSRLTTPSTGFQGTDANNRIWIRAENEGQALIDGQDSGRPADLFGSWVGIWGLNFTRGDNHNILLRPGSSNYLLQRIGSWNNGVSGDSNIMIAGDNHVIEDCFTFGSARKQLAAGASEGTNNVIRRCFGRWERNQNASAPANTAEAGYGSAGITFENNVLTWDKIGTSTSTTAEGIFQLFACPGGCQILGNLFYLTGTAASPPGELFSANIDGGSKAQSGDFNTTINALVKHNVTFASPTHPNFASLKAYSFDNCTVAGCPAGSNNSVTDNVGVAGIASNFASNWTPGTNELGTSLDAAIGAGQSLWTDSIAAPGICARYVNRTLTADPLWPWPMNQRIIDAMVLAGYPPIDVTATLESLFGAIPAACRSGGADTTAPAVAFTAPAAEAEVSGTTVTVTVTATDAVGVVGVQFTLDGVTLQAEDTSAPYTITWNTTSTTNGSHTLGAVARDAAGNTAAATRHVTVNNADVTPPTVSLTTPADQATVFGLVPIEATASDAGGVATVQFKLNALNLEAAVSAPYSMLWDTTLYPNGTHALTATATDSAANSATSSTVTITVNNPGPPSPSAYPSYRYHPSQAPQIVMNANEDSALQSTDATWRPEPYPPQAVAVTPWACTGQYSSQGPRTALVNVTCVAP